LPDLHDTFNCFSEALHHDSCVEKQTIPRHVFLQLKNWLDSKGNKVITSQWEKWRSSRSVKNIAFSKKIACKARRKATESRLFGLQKRLFVDFSDMRTVAFAVFYSSIY